MLLNKKLFLASIMLLLLLLPISYAQVCEVEKIKHALRKALYLHFIEEGGSGLTSNEVKDMLIFYLTISAQNSTVDCSALGLNSNKPLFDVIGIGEGLLDRIPTCAEGTKYGECSKIRPSYCYAGAIYEKCGLCGCPTNSVCGKSGKCEALSQNITCFRDIDCGQSAFVGDYYCSNDYIAKNYVNYTCTSPGTVNSKCMQTNGTTILNYCNPSLNQMCAAGQSTCQLTINDSAPTVAISVSPTTTTKGQFFNVTVTGTDDVGLAAIWWWGVNTADAELNKAHWHNCNGAKTCKNSWLVSTNATGVLTLGANSRDTAYPVAGQPHQASEGAGIAYAAVTITEPGTTAVSGLTIKGRLIDKFTLKPVPNIAIFSSTTGLALNPIYTNANGEFSVSTLTNITSAKMFPYWPKCYQQGFFLLGKKSDGSLYINLYLFDLVKADKNFAVTGSEVDLGDIPLWPAVDIAVNSDLAVQMNIEYPEEGRSYGNINYKTSHYLSNIMPLAYNARVQLKDQSGNIYYSPYKTYGLENGCAPVTLTFSSKQFIWSGAAQTNISNASTCFVKIDGIVVKSVYAADRNDCYSKTSFGSENCKTYAPYFSEGVHFLEQYFGATDRVNNEYCTCTNGVCVQGNVTTTNQTTLSPTGICLVRDAYTSVPIFSAPDLGKGYAKIAKPGVNTFSGLQSACTRTDFDNLLKNYCTQNSNPVQESVMTYNSDGLWQSITCGAYGCDFRNCTASVNQTTSGCNKPLKAVSTSITNGGYGSTLNSYFKIWAYSDSSLPEKRYGYVDYSGWHDSGYDGGVWSIGKMYQSAKLLVLKVRSEAPDFSSPINFQAGTLALTIDGSQFNVNMPAISSVCAKCNHWFVVFADGSVEKWSGTNTLDSWINSMLTSCPSSNVTSACTDSDYGLNYYLYGTTNGYKAFWEKISSNIVTEKDSCTYICSGSVGSGINTSGPCLIEYYCDANNYAAFSVYSCPYGCQNGVCVNQTATCTDSDGGYDYYKYGEVKDLSGTTWKDSCPPDLSGVTEFACKTNGYYTSYFYSCVNENKVCSSGACVPASGNSWCSDPDGVNISQYSVVSYSVEGVSYTSADICVNDDGLVESKCDNKQKRTEYYSCKFIGKICQNGACISQTTPSNQTQLCSETNKLVNFENPPHLAFHLTWNPDLGTQDSYNYNQDETARNWLRAQGIEITGIPNGIVWGTRISGPVGTTGVVIGDASPNFAENDQGVSDNEVLTVRFLNNSAKSITVTLTSTPSNVASINNIPTTVIMDAYNSAGSLVTTTSKTFTGVTNGVYTPTTMSVSSTNFDIAKITLRTTQHSYGGVWLEDINFKVCT